MWEKTSGSKPEENVRVMIAMRKGKTYKNLSCVWVYHLASWNGASWSIKGTICSSYSEPLLWAPIEVPKFDVDGDF